jgi:putative transposase
MTTAFTGLRAAQVSVQAACALTRTARATYYRRVTATRPMHGPHRPRTPPRRH